MISSVIINCYNSNFLKETIDSVLKQTYKNLEIISMGQQIN